MITNVNNKSAKYILSSLLMILISSTCVAAYVSFTDSALALTWYAFSGFLAGAFASMHLCALLLGNVAFSKVEVIHLCLFTVYTSVVACCLAIPVSTVTPATPKFTTLMACFGIELVPLLTVIVALHFKDNQKVQHWLHPLQELVDGFPKSSSTLPMKELHQVIVTTTTTDPAAATTEQTTTNEASNLPKPSQVFKTWPKGPPFPVKALYSFKTTAESELAFRRGDQLMVLDCRGRWWHAEKDDAQRGFIPSNYVQVLLKAEVVVEYAGEAEDELAVAVGSVVEVMERYEEKCLIRTGDGKIGAIPTACLKFSEDEKKDANSIGKENTNDDKENANINVNK